MHRHFISFSDSLDLHRAQTMLPKGDIGGDTILTVVQEDNPIIPIVSYRNLFYAWHEYEWQTGLTFHQGPSQDQCRTRSP